ncbi:hypothetical protein BZA05DRAFT_26157 [Tricharina praecox]|uniref:uncharacterized protein n=1 Tax=Tricharina praecox TaxID=43433 RepID=UPI00221FB30C|nr:uncharacterized protein BZA05DRAFT_26157 [Tricharina praecox]KAI5853347.1 hypothetical protein BZA05DRAFT_26157 [Tricharina praecox]
MGLGLLRPLWLESLCLRNRKRRDQDGRKHALSLTLSPQRQQRAPHQQTNHPTPQSCLHCSLTTQPNPNHPPTTINYHYYRYHCHHSQIHTNHTPTPPPIPFRRSPPAPAPRHHRSKVSNSITTPRTVGYIPVSVAPCSRQLPRHHPPPSPLPCFPPLHHRHQLRIICMLLSFPHISRESVSKDCGPSSDALQPPSSLHVLKANN